MKINSIILYNMSKSNSFDYHLKEGKLVNSISPLFDVLYLYVTKSYNFLKN